MKEITKQLLIFFSAVLILAVVFSLVNRKEDRLQSKIDASVSALFDRYPCGIGQIEAVIDEFGDCLPDEALDALQKSISEIKEYCAEADYLVENLRELELLKERREHP